MKKFQVKHGQCDSIILLYFSFEGSKQLLDFCLADSRILYFWQVLESVHKTIKNIIGLRVLQCLFIRGSNKKQRRGRIISSFTKGEIFSFLTTNKCYGTLQDFFISYDEQVLWYTPKKNFLSPSIWPRREYNWTLNWMDTLLICFENCQGVPYLLE